MGFEKVRGWGGGGRPQEGSRAGGAGTMEHTHMHTRTDTHRGPLTRLPASVHSHTHGSCYLYPSTYGAHVNSQACLHAPYTCSYSHGSFHTIMLMPRQVMLTYMYRASHVPCKFCLCTHTPCMCTHLSGVGSCQCAHTQAAHNPIQMSSSTHTSPGTKVKSSVNPTGPA